MVNKPNNQRKMDTKKRLMRAYLSLITEKKAAEISVSELCKLAGVNRTTFYNNYDNTHELAREIRQIMISQYAAIFQGNYDGPTAENFLRMFRHIKENQTFYKTYFLLSPDSRDMIEQVNMLQARQFGRERLVEYHAEFFAAGITAIIKRWLESGCKESPEEIAEVLRSEYNVIGR